MRSLTQRLHMNCWRTHCLLNHSLDKHLSKACFLPCLTLKRRLRNKLHPYSHCTVRLGITLPRKVLASILFQLLPSSTLRTSFLLILLHCGCIDQCQDNFVWKLMAVLKLSGSKSVFLRFFLALGPLSLEAMCDGNTAGNEASRVGR